MCVDHFLDQYTPEQRRRLEHVERFGRRLTELTDSGYDVTAIAASIDPDPLRYIWVDEGMGRISEFLDAAEELMRQAPRIPGFKRTESARVATSRSAGQPSLAVSPASTQALLAWVEWEPNKGDHVLAAFEQADRCGWDEPVDVSGPPADCFRPRATFDAAGTAWVFYGRGQRGRPAVFCRRFRTDGWGPEEMVSHPVHPGFNQEVVAHPDGRLECVWQSLEHGRFHVVSRTWERGSWGPIDRLTGREASNAWDPVVTSLPGGPTIYAWCSYHGGGYHITIRERHSGRLGSARDITTGSDYAVHPSIALTTDGRLFCAFDLVTIQGHAGSGTTSLLPVETISISRSPDGTRGDGLHFPRDMRPDVRARVHVVEVSPAGVRPALDNLGVGALENPCGLPQLIASESGGLSVVYRVLRRHPLIAYYWEVVTQSLVGRRWSDPNLMAESDGPPEEVSIALSREGLRLAWQTDERRERHLQWTEGWGGFECPHLHDHYGEVIWHALIGPGHIRVAETAAPDGGPESIDPGASVLHLQGRIEARPWKKAGQEAQPRYRTESHGRSVELYWGDLHRHSLISRCTVGDEPSLDDYYRYARDVCEYDFWALTDHAENTTQEQWWRTQKYADLFYEAGVFAPLYGFEWTSKTGHLNVIFGDTPRGAPIYSARAEETGTPDGLWSHLAKQGAYPAVTIPHHPGSDMTPMDWSYQSERFMRLAEVFQACRGSYEYDGCFRQYRDATHTGSFVVDGLRRGHRFGLLASTDHGIGSSFVGLYATGLDRQSLFDALYARRAIGATARDIAVDFRIGENFMGEEGEASGNAQVEIFARGYRELARIDIVRNGVTACSVQSEAALPKGWVETRIRVEWKNADDLAAIDWSGSLTITSGEIEQVLYVQREVTSLTQREVTWSAVAPGFGELYGIQRGGLELTLMGNPDAEVRVVTGPTCLVARLADLAAGARIVSTVEAGILALQPGTGGLRSLGETETKISWEDPEPGPAWYYARVILVDGEMAWSSPIWLD